MCGIGLVVERRDVGSEGSTPQGEDIPHFLEGTNGQELLTRLRDRGPDISSECTITVRPSGAKGPSFLCTFLGSVLALRGSPTKQPLKDEEGNILLWNGEIFGGVEVSIEENDGLILLPMLTKCKSRKDIESLLDTKVQGPWGLIYWQASTKRLWFGRDKVGRRSLMIHKPADPHDALIISSVGFLPPTTYNNSQEGDSNEKEKEVEDKEEKKRERRGGGDEEEDEEDNGESSEGSYWEELPINGLFCIDFASNEEKQEDEGGELLRDESLFDGMVRLTQRQRVKFPHERVVLSPVVTESDTQEKEKEEVEKREGGDVSFPQAVDGLLHVLSDAVKARVRNIPPNRETGKARVGVLFSGGLDSIVLARLIDMHLEPNDEPIDLLNVSFLDERLPPPNPPQQSKKKKKSKARQPLTQPTQQPQQQPPVVASCSGYDRAPDRQTGMRGWRELKLLSPTRRWNFVEVNVNSETLAAAKSNTLTLIHPGESVMDHSIASAIWFAAKGEGAIRSDKELLQSIGIKENEEGGMEESFKKDNPWVGAYVSTAKVLFIGSGADEQLGGYTRHRNAFRRFGWAGLQAEMKKDTTRLWKRNLGRDDRVIASTGKEMRSPYLDEAVIEYLNSVPLYLICDPREKPGVGDKKILRQVAREIGLTDSSAFVKRAIQFGSRIAKMQPPPGGGRKARKMDTMKIA